MSRTRADIVREIKALLEKTTEKGCTVEEATSAKTKAEELIALFKIEPNEIGFTGLTVMKWPETNAHGHPLKTSEINVIKAIKTLGVQPRLDVFLKKYTIEGPKMKKFVGELEDPIVRKFVRTCHSTLQFAPNQEAARQGLLGACEEHAFNSVQDYLIGLRWDGHQRVYNWLIRYFGAEDTPLHRCWGRLVLTAMCKRAYEPGCKFDHILVLEGGEGGGKSTAIKIVANGAPPESSAMTYFCDSPILHLDEKRQQELCAGIWLYELAELAGLTKTDGRTLKRFVGAQADSARAAYAHFKTSQPRTPIFIGSYNPPLGMKAGTAPEYLLLGDRRRWWPLPVGAIDLEALYNDRDQLFAEIMFDHYWKPISVDQYPDKPAIDLVFEGIDPTTRWKIANTTPLTPPTGACFGSLALPEEHWEAAGVIQASREQANPVADVLSNLYDDLIAPAPYASNGQPRLKVADGLDVLAGRDYEIAPASVWVSAALVKRVLGNTDPSGRGTPGAMAANGWQGVRTGKDRTRGYIHDRGE
jgi:hypothetical protein